MAQISGNDFPVTAKGRTLQSRLARQIRAIEFTPDPARSDLWQAIERTVDAIDGLLARRSTEKPADMRDHSANAAP